MHLIIGGVYQGKTAYAIENFGVAQEKIIYCTAETEPDLSGDCVANIEKFVLYCLRNGKNPIAEVEKQWENWSGKVLLYTDMACGVVPIDPEIRAWREEAGRFRH